MAPLYDEKNAEEKRGMEIRVPVIAPILIAIAIATGAFFVARSLERFRSDDRTISVRGFAEREVKADLAVWSFKVSAASDDLAEASRSIDFARTKAMQFLLQNKIDSSEIVMRDLQVTDRRTNEYVPPGGAKTLRYVIVRTIQVRSTNVDHIQRVSRMTDELLRAGVVMTSGDWQGGIRFVFTKLNDVKPAMLAEATQNAKDAALQFTKESNTTLGKMRRANQGLFTITDRDEAVAQQGGGYYGAGTADIFKKVRVVISVDYTIE